MTSQMRAALAVSGIIGLGMAGYGTRTLREPEREMEPVTAQVSPKKQAPRLTARKVEHIAGLVVNMDKAAAKRARKAKKRLQEATP